MGSGCGLMAATSPPPVPPVGRREGALEQAVEALSAGVDDARLFEDRQQVGCAGHGALGGRRGGPQDPLRVRAVGRGLAGADGRLPHDGQDRALDRPDDGGVGRLRAAGQGPREVAAVEARPSAHRGGHAPEDLAEDDAGVASRAHQGAEADRLGDGRQGALGDGQPMDLVQRGADGGGHVGAGVAVGYGEDVEGVDLIDMGQEVPGGLLEGGQQTLPVAGSCGRHRVL